MRILRAKVYFLLILIFLISTIGAEQRPADAAQRPSALLLYPKASNVSSGRNGNDLTYHVNVKYPASDFIGWISNRLQELGWEPLKEDFLNPGLPTSQVRGWLEFVDERKKPELIHQWIGDWKDSSGNIVRYALRYRKPGYGTSDLTDLEVIASYDSASTVRKLQRSVERFKETQQRSPH